MARFPAEPVRAGDAGQGLRLRRAGAGAGPVAGWVPPIQPAAQKTMVEELRAMIGVLTQPTEDFSCSGNYLGSADSVLFILFQC